MAKKTARRKATHKKVQKRRSPAGEDQYALVIHSWIFLVSFAIMLAMGAIVGNFINSQLDSTSPQVAGYQIETR